MARPFKGELRGLTTTACRMAVSDSSMLQPHCRFVPHSHLLRYQSRDTHVCRSSPAPMCADVMGSVVTTSTTSFQSASACRVSSSKNTERSNWKRGALETGARIVAVICNGTWSFSCDEYTTERNLSVRMDGGGSKRRGVRVSWVS